MDADALAAVRNSVAGGRARVVALQLDVTDRARFAATADEAGQAMGSFRVLCNSAGMLRGACFDAVTFGDWGRLPGVKVGGMVNGVQTLGKRMVARGEGERIVNAAFRTGVAASPGVGLYSTSQYALAGFPKRCARCKNHRG